LLWLFLPPTFSLSLTATRDFRFWLSMTRAQTQTHALTRTRAHKLPMSWYLGGGAAAGAAAAANTGDLLISIRQQQMMIRLTETTPELMIGLLWLWSEVVERRRSSWRHYCKRKFLRSTAFWQCK
jgi:hypothetical protein